MKTLLGCGFLFVKNKVLNVLTNRKIDQGLISETVGYQLELQFKITCGVVGTPCLCTDSFNPRAMQGHES